MYKRNNIFVGALFIVLGGIFLLNNMRILVFSNSIFDIGFLVSRLWPVIFLILPGLAFHYAFFKKMNGDPGLLVPGGILIVIGIVCQISFTFHAWHIMWPGFILAAPVGLLELYLYGTREKGLLIPISILGFLSFVFFSITFGQLLGFGIRKLLLPIVLIVSGIAIIFANRPNKSRF